MASFIQLLIITAVLTNVLGYLPTVSNGTENFLKIAQGGLLYKVKLAEMENDALDARFLDRLTVIEQQQQQVMNEKKQVNETLIPLQALNLIRKYCIQTYDSQFLTLKVVKERFSLCINPAKNSGDNLTSSAKSYTYSARDYVTNTLPYHVNYYCTQSKKNITELEQCFIDYVQAGVEKVDSDLNSAKSSRDQSIFAMNNIILTAIKCSYSVEKGVLLNTALSLRKINDCVDDMTKKEVSGNKKALN